MMNFTFLVIAELRLGQGLGYNDLGKAGEAGDAHDGDGTLAALVQAGPIHAHGQRHRRRRRDRQHGVVAQHVHHVLPDAGADRGLLGDLRWAAKPELKPWLGLNFAGWQGSACF